MFSILTPGEKQVVELISQGRSHIEVARDAFMSAGAVSDYTKRIIRHFDIEHGGMVRVVALACDSEFFDEPLALLPPAAPLLPSEHLAVHFVAHGYSAAMDAQTRSIHASEVARQRRHARQKIGALTLPHLVRCCYQLQILPWRGRLPH